MTSIVTNPTAAAAKLTPAGKPAGGAPLDPIHVLVRPANVAGQYEVRKADGAILKSDSTDPHGDAIKLLKDAGVDPMTHVNLYSISGNRERDGLLKDLA
jgi:hypothetical protein